VPQCDICARNEAKFSVKYKPIARAKSIKVMVCDGCLHRLENENGKERVNAKPLETNS
jgi:protein-arginine kinase activator protein McsA